MRVLGIDPGLQTTGFGVVDVEGPRLHYVASGTIKTKSAEQGDLPARLKILYEGIREVVARYQPTVASVEIVFVNVNPQSTLLLGQARGAALAALVSCHLPVHEYTALQMKKAITGHGLARKEQIQAMSRIDSARIASIKAGNAGLSLQGSAVASDAFFPFRDGLDVVCDAGATCVIQPGGSVRDDEVIAAANERGIAMVLTGVRHFRRRWRN